MVRGSVGCVVTTHRTARSRCRGARTRRRSGRRGGRAPSGSAPPPARRRRGAAPRRTRRACWPATPSAAAGWPSAAAPAPLSIGVPLRESSTPSSRRSRPATGVALAEHHLARRPRCRRRCRRCGCATRRPGCRRPRARAARRRSPPSASSVVTPGPARSAASTNASSASTRGATSSVSDSSAPSSTSMSSVSTPNVGSSTPSICCVRREVRPSLRPRTVAPAATRRATLCAWIAYPSAMPRPGSASVSGAIGARSRSARHSASAISATPIPSTVSSVPPGWRREKP